MIGLDKVPCPPVEPVLPYLQVLPTGAAHRYYLLRARLRRIRILQLVTVCTMSSMNQSQVTDAVEAPWAPAGGDVRHGKASVYQNLRLTAPQHLEGELDIVVGGGGGGVRLGVAPRHCF